MDGIGKKCNEMVGWGGPGADPYHSYPTPFSVIVILFSMYKKKTGISTSLTILSPTSPSYQGIHAVSVDAGFPY